MPGVSSTPHPVAGPRYTGSSPTIRRMFEEAASRKIGSKQTADKTAGPADPLGVAAGSGEGCPVAVATSTPSPQPCIHSPLTQSAPTSPSTTAVRFRTLSLQAAVDRLGDVFSKPWRSLWQHEKLVIAFEAAGQAGGLVFTLKLSAARARMLLQHTEPADELRRRIGRELRAAFGRSLPFSFIFEISPITGTLHVHGVTLPPSTSGTDQQLIRQALARAGGKISGRAAGRQVDLKPITDGTGWAAYTQKAFDTACRSLGTNKVGYVSNDLLSQARVLHAKTTNRPHKPAGESDRCRLMN